MQYATDDYATGTGTRAGVTDGWDSTRGKPREMVGFDAPAGGRYPPFHARKREKENKLGWREMRVSAPPSRKLEGFEADIETKKAPAHKARVLFWGRWRDSNP